MGHPPNRPSSPPPDINPNFNPGFVQPSPRDEIDKSKFAGFLQQFFSPFTFILKTVKSPHFHFNTDIPAGGRNDTGILISGTFRLGIYFGSGVPTLTAAQGSLYMRTDGSSTSTRMYINTDGGTTWTNVTTAA